MAEHYRPQSEGHEQNTDTSQALLPWQRANMAQQWALQRFHGGINYHNAELPNTGRQDVSAHIAAVVARHQIMVQLPTHFAVLDGDRLTEERTNDVVAERVENPGPQDTLPPQE